MIIKTWRLYFRYSTSTITEYAYLKIVSSFTITKNLLYYEKNYFIPMCISYEYRFLRATYN